MSGASPCLIAASNLNALVVRLSTEQCYVASATGRSLEYCGAVGGLKRLHLGHYHIAYATSVSLECQLASEYNYGARATNPFPISSIS